jgi:ASC-1-like (ASCH) protein
VRVAYPHIARLRPGDTLILNNRHRVTIHRIARHRDFEELLVHEEASAIAPDLAPDELRTAFHGLYPLEKEALGVVALAVRLPSAAQDC